MRVQTYSILNYIGGKFEPIEFPWDNKLEIDSNLDNINWDEIENKIRG